MCGIVGKYNFTKDDVNKSNILEMMNLIEHRGPNDSGCYIHENIGLGMRRLSIIDIENGKQPMLNEDNSIIIVYNGEIYNYQELREILKAKGYTFETNSDTEVILHLYEEYKEECFAILNGMFAIAIYDKENGTLIISRDRVGIKPLSYYKNADTFIFASEIKSIIANQEVEVIPNELAICKYLIKGKYLYDETFFKNIYHLKPGYYIKIKNTHCSEHQYWDYKIDYEHQFSDEEAQEELRNLVRASVKDQLMAEVPLGSYLSGGIDSSCITYLHILLTQIVHT